LIPSPDARIPIADCIIYVPALTPAERLRAARDAVHRAEAIATRTADLDYRRRRLARCAPTYAKES
jgi:hypothetical protein